MIMVKPLKRVLFVYLENSCRSQMADMVKDVGKDVTMGCGANVRGAFPFKTKHWQIEDPSGKSLEKFREVRQEIRKRVERLIEELGLE
jgi:protein-tyrosine-phosphatase